MITPTALAIDEGGTGTFTVKLSAEPSVNVTVTVESPDAGAVTIAGGSLLSFNRNNWQDERTVTVSGVQDADSLEESVTVTLSATGGDFGGKSGTVVVTVKDDEAPKPNLVLSPRTLTIEEGGTGTFTVKLATEPTASVTVSVGSSRSGIATASPATIAFTALDWEDERTVTVSAQEDSDTRNESANINLSATGGDYEGKSGLVAVSVTDNDAHAPRLVIKPTTVNVREGGTGEFTVRLATRPTAAVTVTVTSDDTGAARVSDGSLELHD